MTWTSVPLRSLYRRLEERDRPDLPPLSVYRDLGVIPREGRTDNYNKLSDDLTTYKVVRPGDIVLNKMKTWQGSIGVSDYEGIVSPAYFIGRRIADVDSRFMHHLLRSAPLIAEYGARSKGIRPSQWDLPWEEFVSIRVKLPPLDAQRTIASYLDRETTRIDSLIEMRVRLNELATVRFSTLGRQLITGGGLAGDRWSPGPTWLGTVPSSWMPRKIAWHMETGSGTTPPSGDPRFYVDEGIPWVTTTELREGVITETAQCVSSLALSEFSALKKFAPGTVLVAMYGATVGRVGVLGVPACTNQACCALTARGPELSARFVYWWLRLHRQDLLDSAYGAGQPNISQDVVRSLRIPAPDPDEQEAIVQRLENEYATLSRLTELSLDQIQLSKERRTALIAAAVTGELEISGVAA